MSEYRIWAHYRVDGVAVNAWLSRYDPNAMPDPIIEFSGVKAEAMTFPTVEAARATWSAVREPEPVRPWDGRPNRPLTAFTVSIE